MKFEIGIDLGAISAVMLALTIFGIAYNSLVAYLEPGLRGGISLSDCGRRRFCHPGRAGGPLLASRASGAGVLHCQRNPHDRGVDHPLSSKARRGQARPPGGAEEMTRPREWPNSAREARDRSAEEAIRALRAIEPLLEKEVTETEKIRRLAIAVSALQTILRLLEREGAQTRP